eukprot:gene15762-17351_t
MKIRPGILEDIDDIIGVHKAAIENVKPEYYSEEERKIWLDIPDNKAYTDYINKGNIFVVSNASSKEGIIAFGHLLKSTCDGEKFEVKSLFVHPEHSRKGIGKMLYEHMETIARDKSCKEIVVNSSLGAIKFYEACGFVTKKSTSCGGSSCRSSCAIQCYWMSKILNNAQPDKQ